MKPRSLPGRPSRDRRAVLAALLALAGLAIAARAQESAPRLPEDTLPRPLPRTIPLGLPDSLADRLPTPEVAALGRRLFFDPILSRDRSLSCASCHDPAHGFADSAPFSSGIDGTSTTRNTPTLFNLAFGRHFFWDGRARSLEEQVLVPIANEAEMALAIPDALARLGAEYGAEFEHAFGGPANAERLASALAGFVRLLLRGDRPVDRFRAGDLAALDPTERAGLWLFESRAGCWRCHDGANFSDEGFHATGIGARNGELEDGRAAVTGDPADRGRFKTPTLRGLSLTAPYMHDGSLATIEDVIEFYRRPVPEGLEGLDPRLLPLELSDGDAERLAAFLRTL